jgi:hypothetical protein
MAELANWGRVMAELVSGQGPGGARRAHGAGTGGRRAQRWQADGAAVGGRRSLEFFF